MGNRTTYSNLPIWGAASILVGMLLEHISTLIDRSAAIAIAAAWILILLLVYSLLKVPAHNGFRATSIFLLAGAAASGVVIWAHWFFVPSPELIYPTQDIGAGANPITFTWKYSQPEMVEKYIVTLMDEAGPPITRSTTSQYLRFPTLDYLGPEGQNSRKYTWNVKGQLRGFHHSKTTGATFRNYKNALQKIIATGKLRVGVEKDVQHGPFLFHKENPEKGFDFEVIRHICSVIGVKCEIVRVPWSHIFPPSGTSQLFHEYNLDASISDITITEERKRLHPITFSMPYFAPVRQAVAVLSDIKRDGEEEIKVTSLDPLKNPSLNVLLTRLEDVLRIGVQSGTTNEDLAHDIRERIKDEPSPVILGYDTYDEMIKDLLLGGVNAIIVDETLAIWDRANNNIPFKVLASINLKGENSLGIIIPSSPSYFSLKIKIDRIIEDLWKAGKINQWAKQYLTPKFEATKPPQQSRE